MKKLLTFLVALIASVSLMAQVTSSSISGKITDNHKGVLAGATVVATHTPSGAQYYAVADANGNYRLLNIRPGGPYKVEYRMVGFQTVIQDGINVLNFKYGYSMTESNGVKFKVEILDQNNTVLKTFTIDEPQAQRYTAYKSALQVNTAGPVKVKFTNLSPSQSTSNKDRYCIWNVNWTNYGAQNTPRRARRR